MQNLTYSKNKQKLRTSLVLLQLRGLKDLFSSNNIDFILLKGSALLIENSLLFEGRKFADIDVLIKPEDLIRVYKSLKGGGYKLIGFNGSNHFTFYNPSQFLPVEVHIGLVNKKSPWQRLIFREENLDLWDGSVPIEKEGKAFRVLNNEDGFIYTCFHMFKEAFLEDKWWQDLEFYYPYVDLKTLLRKAQQAGLLKVVSLCLLGLTQNLRLREYLFKKGDFIEKFLLKHIMSRKSIFKYRFILYLYATDSLSCKIKILLNSIVYSIIKVYELFFK